MRGRPSSAPQRDPSLQRSDLHKIRGSRRWKPPILQEVSPEWSLEGLTLKLKFQYFGHLIRRTDSLEKTLMLGKIEGRRRGGPQRMRWWDGITDSMDMSLSRLRYTVEGRGDRCAAVHGASGGRHSAAADQQQRASQWSCLIRALQSASAFLRLSLGSKEPRRGLLSGVPWLLPAPVLFRPVQCPVACAQPWDSRDHHPHSRESLSHRLSRCLHCLCLETRSVGQRVSASYGSGRLLLLREFLLQSLVELPFDVSGTCLTNTTTPSKTWRAPLWISGGTRHRVSGYHGVWEMHSLHFSSRIHWIMDSFTFSAYPLGKI